MRRPPGPSAANTAGDGAFTGQRAIPAAVQSFLQQQQQQQAPRPPSSSRQRAATVSSPFSAAGSPSGDTARAVYTANPLPLPALRHDKSLGVIPPNTGSGGSPGEGGRSLGAAKLGSKSTRARSSPAALTAPTKGGILDSDPLALLLQVGRPDPWRPGHPPLSLLAGPIKCEALPCHCSAPVRPGPHALVPCICPAFSNRDVNPGGRSHTPCMCAAQIPIVNTRHAEDYVHAVVWRVGRQFGFQAFK